MNTFYRPWFGQMAFRIFQVPVRDDGSAEQELNTSLFLRGHRVLGADRLLEDYLRSGRTRSPVRSLYWDRLLSVYSPVS